VVKKRIYSSGKKKSDGGIRELKIQLRDAEKKQEDAHKKAREGILAQEQQNRLNKEYAMHYKKMATDPIYYLNSIIENMAIRIEDLSVEIRKDKLSNRTQLMWIRVILYVMIIYFILRFMFTRVGDSLFTKSVIGFIFF